MTGPDLRSALHGLGDEVRHAPDLLDRAMATSRRIRRRRVVAGAAGTAAVLVLVTLTVATLRPSGTTVVAPPATSSPVHPSTPPAPTGETGETAPPTTPPPGAPSTPPARPAPAGIGGTVYYLWSDEDGGSSLYSWTGSGSPRLIRADVGQEVTVSPDGTKLAWIEGIADSDPAATVMVSDVDGANERAIGDAHDLGGLCNVPAWSPDSRRVLFLASGDGRKPWVTVDVTSGERTSLDQAGACYPTWAPDGGTIGWYSSAGPILTDALGRNPRPIPPVDGVRTLCPTGIFAVAAGGGRAFVDVPNPDNQACGDGPGRRPWVGTVIDTSSGKSQRLPIDGGLSTAVFLADGGLVGISAKTGELMRLDADLGLVANSPAPPGDDLVLLAYVP